MHSILYFFTYFLFIFILLSLLFCVKSNTAEVIFLLVDLTKCLFVWNCPINAVVRTHRFWVSTWISLSSTECLLCTSHSCALSSPGTTKGAVHPPRRRCGGGFLHHHRVMTVSFHKYGEYFPRTGDLRVNVLKSKNSFSVWTIVLVLNALCLIMTRTFKYYMIVFLIWL